MCFQWTSSASGNLLNSAQNMGYEPHRNLCSVASGMGVEGVEVGDALHPPSKVSLQVLPSSGDFKPHIARLLPFRALSM